MSQRLIAHYRILDPLGAGGMGEVFLAEDTRLHRKVAIKVLPDAKAADEDAKRRLLREARAAAGLDHPNIAAIHEVGHADGQDFIVMQYVEGETLAARLRRGPMQTHETLAIAVQVAEALQEAHAHHLVHRDIKPQNIMLTPRGQVKVLDFGLAKPIDEPALAANETTIGTLTGADTLVGTLSYMSPEQVRQQTLDARSDIFSLGIVLHELLSGQQPFAAPSQAEIVSAILTREPPPLPDRAAAPAELERIVRKCLEKDRERRYQSAHDVVVDLRNLQRDLERIPASRETPQSGVRRGLSRWVPAAGLVMLLAAAGLGWYWLSAPTIRRIAVLPFSNVGGDADMEYLSDGITNNIIDRLGQLPELTVISRAATFRYKGPEIDVPAIARELRVAAVLTGQVTRRNDRLTIALELVDARDSSRIWGHSYDWAFSELQVAQRDIPVDVSDNLQVRLSGQSRQRLAHDARVDPETYQLYLKGRHALEQYSEEGSKQAIAFFDAALQRDSNYAAAYAGLADVYDFAPTPWLLDAESRARAKDAATKALALDETLGDAHASYAQVLLIEWDFDGAEREFRRAIELSPSSANAHHMFSHLLLDLGRRDEALATARRFLDLDPISEGPLNHLAFVYLGSRQYQEAIAQALDALQRYPNSAVRFDLSVAYYHSGRYQESVDEYLRAMSYHNDPPEQVARLRDAFNQGGIEAHLRERILLLMTPKGSIGASVPGEDNEFQIAAIYALLGEREQAFAWLNTAFERKAIDLIALKLSPNLDSLHDDPRFAALLRRVGLPQ